MAPQGKLSRTNISKSDSTVATVLPTYYCLCGEYILVGNVELAHLARRPVDQAFVLRNTAHEQYGAKHTYKLNAHTDKDAIYVTRRNDEGQNAYEKVWYRKCPRCELTVAYETNDPRDKRLGPYTFVLAGALSAEQSAVPDNAFGDEPPSA